MKPTKTIHFGIQRKIVANMTSESWFTTPHAGPVAEFDVTDLLDAFNKLRASGKLQHKLSINTLMLKIIAEGLKAAPSLNAHITYDQRFVKGKIEQFDEIHFSIPMMLPNGEMMTINFHNFENKTLDEMSAYIDDVRRSERYSADLSAQSSANTRSKRFPERQSATILPFPKKTASPSATSNRAPSRSAIWARRTEAESAIVLSLRSSRRRSPSSRCMPSRNVPGS